MKFDAIRVAARALRKQPAFVSAVVVSLALGIAVNTTMYGVLDALIKPRVDMRDPSRLYRAAFFGDYHWTVSNQARDAALMTGLHSYESITRSEQGFGDQLIEHGERARMTPVEGVAANYFDVLGVQPLAGRTFIGADSAAGIRPIVIDETLAEQLFPAGRSPIDARITINLEPRIVVGVISSSSLAPGEHFSAWQIEPEPAAGMYVRLIRLRPGATPQQLDRELQVISARIAATAGEPANGDAFRLHQLMDPDFQFKPIHFGLVAAVVAVLLVACANLANIQLARGIARRRELALRSALGATRQRLVVHLLTESLLLGAGGLLLGLLLTYWVSRLLHASIPPSIGGYIVEPQLSWRVLVFALVATMVCLIAVGLLPSIRVSRTDPNELLKSGAGTGATRGHRRSYAILIGVEIALALALSSFAAITVRTSMHIKDFKYGYDTRPLATGQLSMRSATGRVRAYSDVLASIAAQVRAVRGVEDAAAQSYMMVDKSTITVDDPSGPREFAIRC
ncbi:MAG: FtsX-like permease family protein [Gemmatimonadaceae bacterium]